MQFNSPEYAFFLFLIFIVFWFLLYRDIKLQNVFLLAASYFFYAYWDWRFLSLILLNSSVDYFVGIQLGKINLDEPGKRAKLLLSLSLFTNLGLLLFFKYFNFFSESTVELLNTFGFKADHLTLNIILPLGISFYTFRTLSYTIDVYLQKLKPTKDLIVFFCYVSFFPLLLAGPIERAINLLPQFSKKKEFIYDEAANGMRLILWGVFKKVVIADNCAVLVNTIFSKYETLPGSVLIMGTIYFGFQVYGDFSGYSDIAIGSAKLLGFNISPNFKTPYFSRDIAEFWRRWHISLSSWLSDYIFTPLTLYFRNLRMAGLLISITITFIISGLWHGANWTFIFWGGLNAFYYMILFLTKNNGKNFDIVAKGKLLPGAKEVFQMMFTLSLICLSWIFFRSETLNQAFTYLINIFSHSFFPKNSAYFPLYLVILLSGFILSEWVLFRHENFLERFVGMNSFARRTIYAAALIIIFLFIQNEASTFIYAQF